MKVMSKENCLEHYQWGDRCEAWNFVDDPEWTVKLETMPVGSSESKHAHRKARQFFFIIKGIAIFEIEAEIITVHAGQGIHIHSNQRHKIANGGQSELEFLLTSQPSTVHDRIDG